MVPLPARHHLAVHIHRVVRAAEGHGERRPPVHIHAGIAIVGMKTDLGHLGDGLVRVLPVVEIFFDVFTPEVVKIHRVPGEGVDVQVRSHLLLLCLVLLFDLLLVLPASLVIVVERIPAGDREQSRRQDQ